MRVFVAGATGALGRSLLPRLAEAGHAVIGLTRRPEKKRLIQQLGGEATVADGLDAKAIRKAVLATQPDVVVHEMTDLAGASDLRHFDRVFATSNRLRTEGTDHLLAAAKEAGVRRFVAQSYCGWPYARIGPPVKAETDPLDSEPPAELRATLAAIEHLESVVRASFQPEGIVLRYGSFYGPGTGILDHHFIEQVRHRRFPLIGNGDGWWSFVHVDDAADATVLAVERGAAGEVYNIVDDEPAPVRVWLPALAQILGAKPPFHAPAWVARILAGEHLVAMTTEARAGTNEKARRELGWEPKHASWRTGFAEVLGARADRSAVA
jgi:nucleoside-diphosphate-sugar epimerase